jgi:UDP-N-acetylmuramoyl-tripeptide--D-alanyl-D-alanine ligase
MALFALSELLGLTGARASLALQDRLTEPDSRKYCISTDSRKLADSGETCYLGLKGEKFDGQAFAAQALDNGAALAIISHDMAKELETEFKDRPYITVDDTRRAYQDLATMYRYRVNPIVIGITGSSGKTTTKELCGAIFASARRTHRSQANENNEIGVPKTILSMPEDCQVLIVEMGMRGLKQIDELARCARPDIGIITQIGTAHIELLGSRENIAIAKCELLTWLDEKTGPNGLKGVAILGDDDHLLRDTAARAFAGITEIWSPTALSATGVDTTGTSFNWHGHLGSYYARVHGKHLLQDVFCAIQAASCAGLTDEEIRQGLINFKPVEGRGNSLSFDHGPTIIDETYNANPDSMRCAVEAMLAGKHSRNVVVLARMAELGDWGDELHYDLGRWLADKSIDQIVAIGPQADLIADGLSARLSEKASSDRKISIHKTLDQDEAFDLLAGESGDTCLMIKGSHSTNLDRLVERLSATYRARSI